MVLPLAAAYEDNINVYHRGLVCFVNVLVLWLGLCFCSCSRMSSPTSSTNSANWVLDRRWRGFDLQSRGPLLCRKFACFFLI